MRKEVKDTKLSKKIVIGIGFTGLGLIGKTIYDYKNENPQQSFQSWLLERIFRLFSLPLNQIESKTLYDKGIQAIGEKTEDSIAIPKLDGIKTTETYIDNMQVLLFNDKSTPNQQVIFFLHGGAYIFHPVRPHFKTIENLIQDTDAKVVLPIYPKAPNYDFKDAYPKVLEAYKHTKSNTSTSKNITLMGDSAGGGMAVGLSSLLAAKNLPQPRQLILISPWLDAGSENPNMKKFEASDTLLPSQYYFQKTGRLWARSEDNVYHPLVSPLYTTQLGNLPPMYIITSGDEMLYPDILRFKSYMQEAGSDVHLYVEDNMVHDYAIFDIPEGENARKRISQQLLADR